MMAMRIKEGHFGKVSLSGLAFAATYHWPGPLHEGNGTLQPFLAKKATAEQREALLTILSGKAGNAWFEVVASVVSTVLEPKFVDIEFSFDLAKRTARVVVPGEFETETEPIKNLATGDEHQIRVDMPRGMEYFRPEIASARLLRSSGQIGFDCPGGHSSLAEVTHTQAGLRA